MPLEPDPRRSRDALFLVNSPLIFVLGAVQMTPVESIAEYIPKIQDSMRRKGYPKLSRRDNRIQKIDIATQVTSVETDNRWEFIDPASQWSVLVGKDAISLQTTYYSQFEDFVRRLESALELVHEVIQISGVERIGLRYLDVIAPSDGESFHDYLCPELLGLDFTKLGKRAAGLDESVIATSVGTMIFRKVEQAGGGLAVDPNLLPINLEPRYPLHQERSFCLLDFDHYAAFPKTLEFQLPLIDEKLWSLHDGLDQAFRMAVKPEAMERWKQR